MKIGDIVHNTIPIGVSQSWRPAGHSGIIVNVSKAILDLGSRIGKIETTDIAVLLDDGTVNTYDSKSFKIIDN